MTGDAEIHLFRDFDEDGVPAVCLVIKNETIIEYEGALVAACLLNPAQMQLLATALIRKAEEITKEPS